MVVVSHLTMETLSQSGLAAPTTTTAAQFLAATGPGPVDAPANLYGFGGLHGGIALARLTAAMAAQAPDGVLRAASAHFHRTLRDRFTIATDLRRRGRHVTTAAADAVGSSGEVLLSATAVFGPPAGTDPTVPGPTSPTDAADPHAWDVFEIPTEFVPVAATTEIRPVGSSRPYAAGDRAELTAWVRMVDDDVPPDALRLIFLMDSLAPSYAAVLGAPLPVPTIELSVRPQQVHPTSPWVLLHARTLAARDGWVDEHIDAWDIDGTHLASAHQLRVVR